MSDFHQDEDPPAFIQQDTRTYNNENALLTWILLFLLRLQAEHYITDSAVNSLLKFLFLFLNIIGRQSESVAYIANSFPKSLHQVQKYFGMQDNFSRFVVCKKC